MVGFGRYTWENFIDSLHNPLIALGEFHRIGTQINIRLQERQRSSNGTRVADEDWDNLIILDACRYDMFEEQNEIEGKLERRRSLGSESWEFLNTNFGNETFHDTVYVTANPHAPKLSSDTFHAVINLLESGWDSGLKTVHPETVVEATATAHDRFPNKRIIVHFMQPHFPFIGEFGEKLDHMGIDNPGTNNDETEKRHIWGSLGHGRVKTEDVWKAYRENLDIVLPYADELLDLLSGKSVITADHGNLVGEQIRPIPVRGYGHPRGLDVPELRNVPWLVVNTAERRSIVSEPPIESDDLEEQTVEDRLTALGYK